jgi:hypothetical protein
MKAAAAGLLLMVILAGCDPSNAIHIESGFRADSLVFHAFQRPDSLDGAGGPSSIEVSATDSLGRTVRPVWQLSRDRGGLFSRSPSPVFFRYGADSISGWIITKRAEPLRPGLYVAFANGGGIGGTQRFVVAANGGVTIVGDTFPRRRPGDP